MVYPASGLTAQARSELELYLCCQLLGVDPRHEALIESVWRLVNGHAAKIHLVPPSFSCRSWYVSGAALVAACSQPSTSTLAPTAETKPAETRARSAQQPPPSRRPPAGGRKALRSKPAAAPAAPAAAARQDQPSRRSSPASSTSGSRRTGTPHRRGDRQHLRRVGPEERRDQGRVAVDPRLAADSREAVGSRGRRPAARGRQGLPGLLVQPGRDGGRQEHRQPSSRTRPVACTTSRSVADGDRRRGVRGPVRDRRLAAPVAHRRDRCRANNGKFFETWDQLIELGPKAQKPPRTSPRPSASATRGTTSTTS